MTAPGGRGLGRARRWRLVRADSDAVPPSVRRFMARARRRRLRAALPWATIGTVLALAGLIYWITYGTSVFGVRDVRVTGVAILTAEQVRQTAAVPDREPLARVDLDAVERRVAALAPAGEVTVSRDWPRTIVVAVRERTPVAAVPRGKQFALVDADGVAFHTVRSRPRGLPLVKVATPGPEDPATRAALRVLAALTDQLRGQLSAVSVEGLARIKLELAKGRTVVWGDSSESDTKAKVATALLNRKGDTIDVSAPDVVTIR
ncbi:FtsQ-type POTRA domain-containing protein [Actinomycetes bacterium KLBMP 9797]